MKKYNFILTENAILECDKGISCGVFRSLDSGTLRMKKVGHRVMSEADTGVYGYMFCSYTHELCHCMPGESINNSCRALMVERQPVVCTQSFLPCRAGGIITVKD